MTKHLVRVSDYARFGRSYFVNQDGTFEIGEAAPEAAGCSGFGARLKLGLLSRDEAFCALYELHDEMWLHIRDRRFCLSSTGLRPHLIPWPVARRFALLNYAGGIVFECRYWFVDFRDPFPDSGDFFEYVSRSSRNRHTIARFICCWKSRASSVGPITEAELHAIDDCVKSRLADNRI